VTKKFVLAKPKACSSCNPLVFEEGKCKKCGGYYAEAQNKCTDWCHYKTPKWQFRERSLARPLQCSKCVERDLLSIAELDLSWDRTKCPHRGSHIPGRFTAVSLPECQGDCENTGYVNGGESTQVGLYVLLKTKNGKEFAVMTSHMKAGADPTKRTHKKFQAKRMGEKIAELAEKKIPVIYAGDFNENHTSPAYRELQKAAQGGNKPDKIPELVSAYPLGSVQVPCSCCRKGRETGESTYDCLTKVKHMEMLTENEKSSCCTKCNDGMVEETRPITTAKWRKGGWDSRKIGKKFDTIDFILYSKNAWKRNPNVLKTPEEPLEKLLTPGWKYPSDHWMIAADLEFN